MLYCGIYHFIDFFSWIMIVHILFLSIFVVKVLCPYKWDILVINYFEKKILLFSPIRMTKLLIMLYYIIIMYKLKYRLHYNRMQGTCTNYLMSIYILGHWKIVTADSRLLMYICNWDLPKIFYSITTLSRCILIVEVC